MSKTTFLPAKGWAREGAVLAHIPFGRTKLRSEIAAGRFPKPKAFSARVVAFSAEEVHSWIEDPDRWIAEHAEAK